MWTKCPISILNPVFCGQISVDKQILMWTKWTNHVKSTLKVAENRFAHSPHKSYSNTWSL